MAEATPPTAAFRAILRKQPEWGALVETVRTNEHARGHALTMALCARLDAEGLLGQSNHADIAQATCEAALAPARPKVDPGAALTLVRKIAAGQPLTVSDRKLARVIVEAA